MLSEPIALLVTNAIASPTPAPYLSIFIMPLLPRWSRRVVAATDRSARLVIGIAMCS
jgi:hypothetical protein